MPRIKRKNLNSNIFHIMSQGINKEYIFEKEQDKRKYRKLIFLYNNEFNIEIIAYCIMGNHVYLLIKSDRIENMSNFMHQINMQYALYYNKNRNRVGYVFRSRYKSEQISTEKYLINCIHYIHNNPIKAHICREKLEYLYSSYNYKIKENQVIDKSWRKKYYNTKYENKNISFIATEEEKEQDIKETIENFLNYNKVKMEEIREKEEKLIQILKILMDKKISMRKIEKIFNIDKKKIKRLIKKSTC